MHAVFANLMAGVLSIHALVGCCWLHAQSTAACEHSAVVDVATPCCAHHHDTPCSKEQPAEQSCPCCAEGHGACAFLPTQKSQLDALHFVSFLPAAILSADVAVEPAVTSAWWEAWGTTGIEPPVRLHLVHRVLLI